MPGATQAARPQPRGRGRRMTNPGERPAPGKLVTTCLPCQAFALARQPQAHLVALRLLPRPGLRLQPPHLPIPALPHTTNAGGTHVPQSAPLRSHTPRSQQLAPPVHAAALRPDATEPQPQPATPTAPALPLCRTAPPEVAVGVTCDLLSLAVPWPRPWPCPAHYSSPIGPTTAPSPCFCGAPSFQRALR